MATVSAPARRAAATTPTMSGLWPDCEMASTRPPDHVQLGAVDRRDRWLGQAGRQAELRLEQVLRVDRGVVARCRGRDHDPARPRLDDGRRPRRAARPAEAASEALDRIRESGRSRAACASRGGCDHRAAPNCGRYGRFASSSASSSGSTSPIRPPTSGCASSAARTSSRSPLSGGADGEALEVPSRRARGRAWPAASARCGDRVRAVAVDSRRDLDHVVRVELGDRAVVADVDHLDVAGAIVERREQLRGRLAVERAAAVVQQARASCRAPDRRTSRAAGARGP